MSEPSQSGWSPLTTEAISALDAKDFERLCHAIVGYEAYDRHDNPGIEGPAGEYVSDQGRDILLSVGAPPVEKKLDFQRRFHTKPVTEDREGRTVYSCKSGKSWLDDALKDARDERRGQRAVEVLGEGGHFKLLVGQPAQLDRAYKRDGVEATPHQHLLRVFAGRLRQPPSAALGKRIEILDAQKLRDFLVAVAPEKLLNEWASKLGLARMLSDIAAWQRFHLLDRQPSGFEYDEQREAIRDELLAFFASHETTPAARAARLLGPPGIGKTRLVLECLLGRPDLAARLRVARDSAEAREAFQRDFWANHPDALVVVDDCSDEDVRGLVATFAAKTTQPRAHLLLITPTKESAQTSQLKSWVVPPLASNQARRLLSGTVPVEIEPSVKEKIVSLAEGFPWFVILLAREVEQILRGPRDMDEAVDWVLASSSEATGAALASLRQDRARSLLAVALTRSVDWNNLDDPEQDRLVKAVGLQDWGRLRDIARQCHGRGLVRLQLGWHFKYVTPAVLEREILRRLLGPNGPDPGGKKLFFNAGPWAEQLFERLPSLGLPPEAMRALALSALADLRAVERLDQMTQQAMVGERLLLVASWFPRDCARELRRLLASPDLRSFSEGRRDVVEALERILLQTEGLEDAEAALFLLALAENERFSNNATAVWASLFFVEMTFVSTPIEQRIELLRARLQAATPAERLLALKGLEAAMATPAFRLVPQGAGKPLSLPPEALRRARVQAWSLLGERLHDAAEEVARAARALARKVLASGGPPGILAEALAQLLDGAHTFRDKERAELVALLRDSERLARVHEPEVRDKLLRLRAALEPRSLHDRLREQIGLWGNDEARVGVTPQDESLAQEVFRDLPGFEPELDWVLSGEAERRLLFARALGRHDPLRSLLRVLLRHPPGMPRHLFVAAYFRGLQDALPGEHLRAALDDLRDDPSTFPDFALAAAWCGLSGGDAQAIAQAFDQRRVDEETLAEILRLAPGANLPEGDVSALLEVVLRCDSPLLLEAAILWASARVRAVPGDANSLGPLLDRLLARYASSPGTPRGDHGWERLALARWEHSQRPTLDAISRMLGREGGPPEGVWRVFSRACEQAPVASWAVLASALEQRAPGAARLLLSFRFQDREFPLPVDEVVTWVGDDERRGRAVVSLVPPFQPRLPEVLRRLVVRFGPDSSISREIAARMHSTTRTVPSLAHHDAARLEVARAWLQDEEPAVQTLARRVVHSLEEDHAYHEAMEEEERLRYGS